MCHVIHYKTSLTLKQWMRQTMLLYFIHLAEIQNTAPLSINACVLQQHGTHFLSGVSTLAQHWHQIFFSINPDPILTTALWLMVTVPVRRERSFSLSFLKLIKTHLRTTMVQKHLWALAQISIKHEVTRSVDKDELIWALYLRRGKFQSDFINNKYFYTF